MHSLVSLLATYEGQMPFSEAQAWLVPMDGSLNSLTEALGCASSLGFVAKQDQTVSLSAGDLPTELPAFLDRVHEVLATAPGGHIDRELFEAYAAVVLRTELSAGSEWIARLDREAFAGRIRDDLKNQFNSTKLKPWREWMRALGMGWRLGSEQGAFFPDPTRRLARELRPLARQIGTGNEVAFDAFLEAMALRMPYLDRGSVFAHVAQTMGYSPKDHQLSRVLSNTLRELHDQGLLKLHQVGDAAGAVALVREPTHPINHVSAVTLSKELAE